jgi:hypothetical protein
LPIHAVLVVACAMAQKTALAEDVTLKDAVYVEG